MNKTIKLLKDFSLGGESYSAGTVLEVSEEVATVLIAKDAAEETSLDDVVADGISEPKPEVKEPDLDTAIVSRVKERRQDDPKGGYQFFSEFALDVWKAGPGGVHPPARLKEWSSASKALTRSQAGAQKQVMVEYDDEQGGYLVPTEFKAQLLMQGLENQIVRPRATEVPMQTNSVSFPAINDTTHAGNAFWGGLTVYRPGESAAKTPSKPDFAKVTLTLHKLVCLTPVSDELLEDSPVSIEPLLRQLFGEAIGFVMDDDFINGTGVNMALGGANAGNPSLIVVPRTTLGRIRGMDLIRMWSRLYPNGAGNAVWLFNQDCFPDIVTAAFRPNSAIAQVVPMFVADGDCKGAVMGTILGRPAIITEKCQTLGTQGDVFLVDWSQYLVGMKAGGGLPKFDSSMHLYFNYDRTAFRAVLRYDGQPWWLSDMTPAHSANTYSPFVVLGDTTTYTTTAAATTTGA
jgi:HK97 family phage major capsid protein